MADHKGPSGGDYKVGYGKPPKHTQFAPGQSGNAGRRKKKPPEPHAKMLARIVAEKVEVGGKYVSKIELAVHQTVNQTIKSGKARDLKLLLDMLKEHGLLDEGNHAEEMRQAADETMQRIGLVMARTMNRDPADLAAILKRNQEEADLVMACANCGPKLRERWKDPEYKALANRSDTKSKFHSEGSGRERQNRLIKNWEEIPRDVR